MNYYLGIDMGGTVIKAALFDENGNEVKTCGKKLTIIYPAPDMYERSSFEARDVCYAVIANVIKESGINSADIKGIGCTGQGNGLYMFDEKGEPVYNGIMSSDMRAKEYIVEWLNDGTWKDKLLPKINQQIWAGMPLPIMRWFKDYKPEVINKAKHCVTAKEYIRYLLTGEFCLEYTEASGTGSMDQSQRKQTQEIFDIYGIGDLYDKYPKRIVECVDIVGTVTKECAEKTGLKEGTPVVGGQMDTGACTISAGVLNENQLGMIVGSWSINSIVRNKPVTNPNLFMCYEYCLKNMFCYMEGSSTSGTNKEWFLDNLMSDIDHSIVYKETTKMVESTPYKDSIIFLPFLYGTNAHINAKASFIGLKGSHTRAEMVRAVHEGIIFSHKYHVERLLPYIDKVDSIRMAGGGAKSKDWMQMFSDIFGYKVETSEAEELGAMGVAMEAAVGTGQFKTLEEVVDKWVKIKDAYEPDKERTEYYEEKYKVYKKIIDALDSVWDDIDKLD